MFFGKPEVEYVQADSLGAYAAKLFDQKFSRVYERCDRALARIDSALEDFERACVELEHVEEEPDQEYIGRMSPNSVKEQKMRYTRALAAAISALRRSQSAATGVTTYESIMKKKRLIEEFIEHALKLNASFRGVFIGYGNYFDNIKRSFKSVENSMSELKAELDKSADDFSNYQALRGAIEKLNSMEAELGSLSENKLESMQDSRLQSLQSVVDSEITDMDMKESRLLNDIESISKEEQSIITGINAVLKPLERAARKYDHEAKSRFKLSEAISKPIEMLGMPDSYALFKGALIDMQAKISSIEPNPKELELAKSQISMALSANIQDSILEIFKLRERKELLMQDLNIYNIKIGELKSRKKNEEEAKNAVVQSEERKAKLTSNIDALKGAIEGLFYSYYKKRIKITYK